MGSNPVNARHFLPELADGHHSPMTMYQFLFLDRIKSCPLEIVVAIAFVF